MYNRILVPIDGSETAQAGLEHAVSLARGQPATLLLLHLLPGAPALPGGAGHLRDGALTKDQHRHALELLSRGRQAVEGAGLHCETLLREFTGKSVADAIEEQALQHRCDLVVIGTHGRRGLAWLAEGSQAQQLARAIRMPLLLVPVPPPPLP